MGTNLAVDDCLPRLLTELAEELRMGLVRFLSLLLRELPQADAVDRLGPLGRRVDRHDAR